MKRMFTLLALSIVCALPAFGGQFVRIMQRPLPSVENNSEASIKRIPEGEDLVLTVNKGQNINGYQVQWFKDGQPLEGETYQELRRPMSTSAYDGDYTVQMTSPCASVMSKPMHVVVQLRHFQVNTELPSAEEAYTGLHETTTSNFELKECQPNPVNDKATITFVTKQPSDVTLKIVDLNGNVVATLVNDVLPAGTHDVTFNTQEHNMSSSMYYYVLAAPGFTDTKPLMIVK